MAGKEPRQSHRFTLRVPAADTSVSAWWAAQDDASASVRKLVRDEIQRHGLTDTANRPVSQLPKRGRPSFAERVLEPDDDMAAALEAPSADPAELTDADLDRALESLAAQPSARAAAGTAHPAANSPESADAPEQAPPEDIAQGAQVDMDAIFGH